MENTMSKSIVNSTVWTPRWKMEEKDLASLKAFPVMFEKRTTKSGATFYNVYIRLKKDILEPVAKIDADHFNLAALDLGIDVSIQPSFTKKLPVRFSDGQGKNSKGEDDLFYQYEIFASKDVRLGFFLSGIQVKLIQRLNLDLGFMHRGEIDITDNDAIVD